MNRHDVVGMVTSEKAPWELQEVEVKGATQKWFVNGPQSLRQLYEDNLSDEPFYAYEDECYTFQEVYRRAGSLAQQLQSRYGVKHGDRVAIAMRNYPEWPIALEAITSIGAIAVAINAWWQPEEIDYGNGKSTAGARWKVGTNKGKTIACRFSVILVPLTSNTILVFSKLVDKPLMKWIFRPTLMPVQTKLKPYIVERRIETLQFPRFNKR